MGKDLSDAATEIFRCEVREFLRFMVQKRQGYVEDRITKIKEVRGAAAAERLRAACSEQWRAGNRGEFDDWRELGLGHEKP